MTGSHGQQLFNIQRSKNHGRLYLPEALVLHPDEYAQKKTRRKTHLRQEKLRNGILQLISLENKKIL